MAAAAMEAIYVLSIAKVRFADSLCQRILCVRDRYDVNMIAHQAIADQFQSVLVRLLFQQFQIYLSIIVNKEHVLAVVAALRDMMCKSDRYCSG